MSTKYYEFIDLSINRLAKYEKGSALAVDTDKVLFELSAVVPKKGISIHQLNTILDIILDPTNSKSFTNLQKQRMIKLLITYDLVDFDTTLKILSSFKVPTYSSSKKFIARKLQINLSKWIVSNFPNLVQDKRHLRLLPFIFNLISIGYIRENICIFIVYILLGSSAIDRNFKPKYFLNRYTVDLVSEMLLKDNKVLPLALVIDDYLGRNEMAQLGPQYYRLHNIIETESTPSQYPFGELDMTLLDSIEQVKVAHGSDVRSFEDHLNAYFQTVQFLNLKHSRGSDIHSKRVKLEGDSGEYSTTALLENITLGDCITAQSYCDQLGLFQTRNQRLVSLLVYLSEAPYSRESKNSLSERKLGFLRLTTPFPILYPLIDSLFRVNYNGLNSATSAMLGILGNSPTVTSEYHTVFSGLLEITRHSFEMLDIVHRIIDGRLIANEEDLEFSVRFWSFIPYYPLAKWESFTPTLERLKGIANEKETVIRLVISITSMLENWLVRMQIEDRFEDLELWNCINMVLAEMMRTIAARCFSKADESIELMMVLLRLIQFTHTMPFQFVRISDLVLSPTLAYSMYFTSNPILIDYLCRHVTYCKKYFGEYGSNYISDRLQGIEVENDINGELSLALLRNIKEIHNSYVMDLCNIVWRDKAFEKTDKSKGKGFLLPDQFTGQLLKVGSDANIFIKRGYNIFYAPAFASIITGIIRTTEDQHLSKRRLAGPLNEEEYSKLLPTESYDQFRTVILDRLHDIGFAGLGNLLFSSLKSLSRIKLEKGKSSSAQLQSV